MKRRIYILLLSAILILTIFLLKKYTPPLREDIKSLIESSDTLTKKINIDSIAKDILKFTPIYTTIIQEKNSSIIYCISSKNGPEDNDPRYFPFSLPKIYLYKISKPQEEWVLEKEIYLYEIVEMVRFENDFEVIKIGDNEYLYFSTSGTMLGNAVPDYGSYSFILISLSDFKKIELTYEGLWDDNSKLRSTYFDQYDVDGNLILKYSDPLTKIKDVILKDFFSRKINSSNHIYIPTSDDFNIEHSKNYREKWKYLNRGFNIYNKLSGDSLFINTKYYDENIFPRKIDVYSSELIQNKFYSISWMKNTDILVYDKRTNKFFPILVDDCIRHCSEQLYFINDHEIEVVYETGIVININVETKTVKIKKINED
jgi:hypothetical protein